MALLCDGIPPESEFDDTLSLGEFSRIPQSVPRVFEAVSKIMHDKSVKYDEQLLTDLLKKNGLTCVEHILFCSYPNFVNGFPCYIKNRACQKRLLLWGIYVVLKKLNGILRIQTGQNERGDRIPLSLMAFCRNVASEIRSLDMELKSRGSVKHTKTVVGDVWLPKYNGEEEIVLNKFAYVYDIIYTVTDGVEDVHDPSTYPVLLAPCECPRLIPYCVEALRDAQVQYDSESEEARPFTETLTGYRDFILAEVGVSRLGVISLTRSNLIEFVKTYTKKLESKKQVLFNVTTAKESLINITGNSRQKLKAFLSSVQEGAAFGSGVKAVLEKSGDIALAVSEGANAAVTMKELYTAGYSLGTILFGYVTTALPRANLFWKSYGDKTGLQQSAAGMKGKKGRSKWKQKIDKLTAKNGTYFQNVRLLVERIDVLMGFVVEFSQRVARKGREIQQLSRSLRRLENIMVGLQKKISRYFSVNTIGLKVDSADWYKQTILRASAELNTALGEPQNAEDFGNGSVKESPRFDLWCIATFNRENSWRIPIKRALMMETILDGISEADSIISSAVSDFTLASSLSSNLNVSKSQVILEKSSDLIKKVEKASEITERVNQFLSRGSTSVPPEYEDAVEDELKKLNRSFTRVISGSNIELQSSPRIRNL